MSPAAIRTPTLRETVTAPPRCPDAHRVLGQHLGRAIRARTVNDDHLERAKRLTGEALERAAENVASI